MYKRQGQVERLEEKELEMQIFYQRLIGIRRPIIKLNEALEGLILEIGNLDKLEELLCLNVFVHF